VSRGIVIVGGGQTGAQAVETLRRESFGGSLTLISDESMLPYQRPPLSKKYLSGELAADRLLIRHQCFYDEHHVTVRLSTKATRINRREQLLSLDCGEVLPYEQLLLCTGAESRRLMCTGSTLIGVHYLRDVNDVHALRPKLTAGVRVVIVGGGYIGLEVAATARNLGCSITVLELADRLMNRVVAPCVSEYFEMEHRRKGVTIICNTRVERLEGDGRVERVICSDGNAYAADVLVVGVGAMPNTEIAEAAGLNCQNGVVVDEFLPDQRPEDICGR
jgi:3-phenylpropionate/trans-cinnamate dioxygenase ferredoxin reductase subunit